jgi:hypothetical protein
VGIILPFVVAEKILKQLQKRTARKEKTRHKGCRVAEGVKDVDNSDEGVKDVDKTKEKKITLGYKN